MGLDDKISPEDLPKIIVEEDRIIVLSDEEDILNREENDWIARNLKVENSEEEEDKKIEGILDFLKDIDIGGEEREVRDEDFGNLEKSVGGSDNVRVENNFYNVENRAGDFYETNFYDEKSGVDYVEIKVKDVDMVEDEERGARSMLEIAGFRDEEAEKKRRERREGNFI